MEPLVDIATNELIRNIFYGMGTILGGLALKTLNAMAADIAALNIKIAVVVSELKNHDHRLNNLENKR